MYGVHISFLVFLSFIPIFRMFLFLITTFYPNIFKKLPKVERDALNEKCATEFEYYTLLSIRMCNRYINKKILETNDAFLYLVFFRAIPWMLGTAWLGVHLKPLYFFLFKFFLFIFFLLPFSNNLDFYVLFMLVR